MKDKIVLMVKKNSIYILAFLVPWMLVLVHSVFRDGWLMGHGSILRGDAGLQYYQLAVELWEKVHSGESFFYSWNAGGGFDFYLNFAYYLLSPFMIIVLLFPKGWIEETIQVVMVLKWSCIAVSMVYFFMHTKFNKISVLKRTTSFMLGMSFALSNIMISYVAYFNWNDVIILLPLLLLQLEKLVENKNWKIYYLLLLAAMLFNFYLAYEVCIFLILWFLLLLNKDTVQKGKKIGLFIGSSILSAVTSAIVILPCMLGVSGRHIEQTEQSLTSFSKLFLNSVTDIIQKFFIFDDITDTFSMKPNVYYSIGAVSMVMLFLFVKYSVIEKIKRLALFIVFFLSFCIGPINLVWHGFNVPNGIYNRFTFLFVFICLFILMEVLGNIKNIHVWHAITLLAVELIGVVITFFNIDEYLDFYVYLITIMLVVLNSIILILYLRKSITYKSFLRVFCILVLCELFINGLYQFSDYNICKIEEYDDSEAVNMLLNNVQMDYGEKINDVRDGYNFGLSYSVPSENIFLSYTSAASHHLQKCLGMETSNTAGHLMQGASPIENLIYNIRYVISPNEILLSDGTLVSKENDINLYRIKHLAGLGYMVSSDILNWNYDRWNSFAVQNDFTLKTVGIDDIFVPAESSNVFCENATGKLKMDESMKNNNAMYHYQYDSELSAGYEATQFTYVVQRDMDLYVNGNNSVMSQNYVYLDDVEICRNTTKRSYYHIGKVKKGQVIKIVSVPKEIEDNMIVWYQFCEFRQEKFDEAYKRLSRNVIQIDKMESNYIHGSIGTDMDGLMLTSVHVEKGFQVFVDGKKTKYQTVGGALMAIPLTKGEHEIVIQYKTPYFSIGASFSVIGICAFVLICLWERNHKNNVVKEEMMDKIVSE